MSQEPQAAPYGCSSNEDAVRKRTECPRATYPRSNSSTRGTRPSAVVNPLTWFTIGPASSSASHCTSCRQAGEPGIIVAHPQQRLAVLDQARRRPGILRDPGPGRKTSCPPQKRGQCVSRPNRPGSLRVHSSHAGRLDARGRARRRSLAARDQGGIRTRARRASCPACPPEPSKSRGHLRRNGRFCRMRGRPATAPHHHAAGAPSLGEPAVRTGYDRQAAVGTPTAGADSSAFRMSP